MPLYTSNIFKRYGIYIKYFKKVKIGNYTIKTYTYEMK